MPRRRRPATTRVPALLDMCDGFRQKEVIEMLGASKDQISRDCKTLWPDRPLFSLLNKTQVRTLYCVAMYRHVQYARGRHQILTSEIQEFINENTDEQIWAVVALAGGSQEDCNAGIEEMLIKRNQRRIQQETINVSSTVA
ncbi:MAG: hypothetical protein ACTS2F_27710 [Thainema sp.]